MAISGGDGSIILTTQIDQTGLKRGMASMKSGVSSLSKSFKKIGSAIGVAFGVKALIDFGKQAVQLASDLQEVQNVVDVAFGDMSYKIEEFSKTAIEQFGISELTAKRTASTYMAMAKGIGIAADTGSDMAIQLTALSADMASFYNVSQEMADTALKSIFTGETETLKQYGIVMTEVNLEQFALSQGITKSISAMTQQEKTMLRYNFVLQQTALAQGDFARTSDSWANQTRVLTERWKEMQRQFGEAFIAIGTLVLPVINSIIDGLTQIAQYAKVAAQSIYKLFTGKEMSAQITQAESDAINNSVENQNELTEAVKETEKAQNDLVASFDKLNIISQNNADDIINQATDSLTSSNSQGIDKAINDIGKSEINWEIPDYLNDLYLSLEKLSKSVFEGLKWGYDNVFIPLKNFTITEILPRFFKTLANAFDFFAEVFTIYKELWKQFISEFLSPIAAFAAPKFLEFWDEFNLKFQEISQIINNSEAFEDLKQILSKIYDLLLPIAENLSNIIFWIADFQISNTFIEFKFLLSEIKDFIGLIAALLRGDFSDAFSHLKNLLIDNPIDALKEKFELLKEKVEEVAQKIKISFTNALESLKDNFPKIIESIENFFSELPGKIGYHLGRALGTIAGWGNDVIEWAKEKVPEIVDNIVAFFKDLPNKIKDIFNKIIDFFNKMPEKSLQLGKNLLKSFIKGILSIKDWFLERIDDFFGNFFGGFFDGFKSNSETVDISNIPKLARGAVIPPNREFAAILGDNKKENEIVAPESTLEKLFKKALSEMSPSNSEASFTIMLDGDVLYKGVKKAESKRNGLQFSNPALAR